MKSSKDKMRYFWGKNHFFVSKERLGIFLNVVIPVFVRNILENFFPQVNYFLYPLILPWFSSCTTEFLGKFLNWIEILQIYAKILENTLLKQSIYSKISE